MGKKVTRTRTRYVIRRNGKLFDDNSDNGGWDEYSTPIQHARTWATDWEGDLFEVFSRYYDYTTKKYVEEQVYSRQVTVVS